MYRKKEKYHILIGLLIAVCMLMNGIPVSAVNSSEVAVKLNQIAGRYPEGSFFSVDGQACTHTNALTCSNCELLKIYPDLKGKVSDAWTCCSFARYVYYELFHVNSYNISTNSKEVSLANAKAGDMVMFYTGSKITHYAIYLYSDGVTGKHYLYESNYGIPNKIRYGGGYSAVQLANVKIWHANNYDADGDVVDVNANTNTDSTTGGAVTGGSMGAIVPSPTPGLTLLPLIPKPTTTATPIPTTIPLPISTPAPTSVPAPMPSQVPTPLPVQKPKPTPTPIPLPVPDSKPGQAPTQIPLLDSVPKPAPGTQPPTGKTGGISVANIKINKTRLELGKGKAYQLNAMILPQKASNKKVSWFSNNKSVATVNSSGIVKGISKGITYVYVRSADGKKEAKCMVTIY